MEVFEKKAAYIFLFRFYFLPLHFETIEGANVCGFSAFSLTFRQCWALATPQAYLAVLAKEDSAALRSKLLTIGQRSLQRYTLYL